MSLVSVFCLHALYTILDEIDGWRKLDDIFRYFHRINPSFNLHGEEHLYFGAITNLWVIFWCVIDSYFVIGGCHNPSDCIMDALGLLFLFNLDDVSGDVTFVSADAWPGDRLGWVFANVVKENYEPIRWSKTDKLTQAMSQRTWQRLRFAFATCRVTLIKFLQYLMLAYCTVMVVAVPVAVAITPFLQIVPHEVKEISPLSQEFNSSRKK